MFALIDGDSILYKAACSVQKTEHKGYNEFGKLVATSTYIREIKANPTVKTIKSEIIAEPVTHAIHNASNIIKKILTATKATDYVLALSHIDKNRNFRHQVEGNREYKANRTAPKPVHFDKVRAYVFRKYKTKEVDGYEAEDYVGIMSGLMTKKGIKNVIVGIDKDLRMLPGLHYNYDHEEFFSVKDPGTLELIERNGKKVLKGTGFKWFCAQMLLGDPVDNIEGIKGYGDVKTYERLRTLDSRDSLWSYVSALYRFKEKTETQLEGTKKLLWILREPIDASV